MSVSNQLASYMFQYYKPIVDRRILTEPLVEKRSRFSTQEEILDSNLDAYFLRVLYPIRNGRETLAIVEVFDQYYIRDAYIGRNSIRLNLLIGMSVITLMLGWCSLFLLRFHYVDCPESSTKNSRPTT